MKVEQNRGVSEGIYYSTVVYRKRWQALKSPQKRLGGFVIKEVKFLT